MKATAVRLHGKKDLRLETYELPAIKDDEILAKVISDSVCMSTYKAAIQGSDHKRVPADIAEFPIVVGHEFAGEIVEVGKKWKSQFSPGKMFSIQPNINSRGLGYAPGYSFPFFGGDATYIVIPAEVMEKGCLLDYEGDSIFKASLSEPMSCIIAAFHASYHTKDDGQAHKMGIIDGGTMAILAGVGPMGMGAIDIALHGERKPKLLVVTDIDDSRLERAKSIFTPEAAAKDGTRLEYVNTKGLPDAEKYLRDLTDGKGFDDVFIFAPVKPVVELGDRILGKDGCMNFFAGPTDPKFSAEFNFYNVHYSATHIVGTSGGNTRNMVEALDLMGKGLVNPAVMVTHVGGLDSAAETTLNLPQIPGGKKLIYPHIKMELTAIDDMAEKGKNDPLFAKLADLMQKSKGLWSADAEKYLLANAKPM